MWHPASLLAPLHLPRPCMHIHVYMGCMRGREAQRVIADVDASCMHVHMHVCDSAASMHTAGCTCCNRGARTRACVQVCMRSAARTRTHAQHMHAHAARSACAHLPSLTSRFQTVLGHLCGQQQAHQRPRLAQSTRAREHTAYLSSSAACDVLTRRACPRSQPFLSSVDTQIRCCRAAIPLCGARGPLARAGRPGAARRRRAGRPQAQG